MHFSDPIADCDDLDNVLKKVDGIGLEDYIVLRDYG